MRIIIDLTSATICFLNGCFPALIGTETPVGEFVLERRITDQAGYGGDVLQFHETETRVFAIHRPWLQQPRQKRLERLHGDKVGDRLITNGCVNVADDVYEALLNCCQGKKIIIQR